MSEPTQAEIEKRTEEIRRKRIETLVGAWELVRTRYRDIRENARLNDALVAEAVEAYLQDRQVLVTRANIRGRIQRHKIAGLMAAAIVKTRPIQLFDETAAGARISRDNEVLAILHGLAICAEGKFDAVAELMRLPAFHVWYSDFIYFLVRRHDSAESCAMIFETLSLTYFPGNLDKVPPKGELS
jgi:hypothetical protein